MTIAILGSGPAGVAAAQALADSGLPVTLLDAGDRIEAGRMDAFAALAQSEPERWPPELARSAREGFTVGIGHVPLKPAYGSLFPYALDDPDLPVARERVEALPSLAYGGLSNSWGASVLPFRQRDIADWPVSLAELRPHYEAVLRFVPLAARHDELAETLPLYTDSPSPLRRALQAEVLLGHLRRHSTTLRAAGFTFGAARLAVSAAPDDPRHCRYSGMCLHGCPYGSIYNATHTLDSLVREARIDYRGNLYVDRLSEADGSVRIDFHDRRSPARTGSMTASRVLVACGAISSTRLVLDSLGLRRTSTRLRDSQYFVIPMLARRSTPVSVATQGNTLAGVFVELEDPRIAARSVHLQLYGYNDLLLQAATGAIPLDSMRIERLLRPLLGRLFTIQGYLHSEDSPGLSIELAASGIRLVGDDGALAAIRIRRLVRRLAAAGRDLGMLPLPQLVQIGLPGKSNHLGGSFPMRADPRSGETDTLGRPHAWRRVHIVDASIFPSVPATTITLSVMANAHRIATAVAAAEIASHSG
ncbi:MAG TPA: GMC oxidoreductase [Solirubrobacteraceae bacterium]|jgi:choline dehydrogenase-like flavoprotein